MELYARAFIDGEQPTLAGQSFDRGSRANRGHRQKKELVFPKIPKDYKPSAKVLAMTCGPLPEGVDLEKELEERWEEWAK